MMDGLMDGCREREGGLFARKGLAGARNILWNILQWVCRGMKAMKRILLLILGYFLIVQAALGVLMCCGQPQNAALILIVSGFFGWAGYKLLKIADRK